MLFNSSSVPSTQTDQSHHSSFLKSQSCSILKAMIEVLSQIDSVRVSRLVVRGPRSSAVCNIDLYQRGSRYVRNVNKEPAFISPDFSSKRRSLEIAGANDVLT